MAQANTQFDPEVMEAGGFNPWMRDKIYTADVAAVEALDEKDFSMLELTIKVCRKAGVPFRYVGVKLKLPQKGEELTDENRKALALQKMWPKMQEFCTKLPPVRFMTEKSKTAGKLNDEDRAMLAELNAKEAESSTADNPFAALAALKG